MALHHISSSIPGPCGSGDLGLSPWWLQFPPGQGGSSKGCLTPGLVLHLRGVGGVAGGGFLLSCIFLPAALMEGGGSEAGEC